MRIAIILIVIGILGCTVTPKTHVIENQSHSKFLPFVRDGITNRREILDRLGEPASSYEGNRIVTYWFHQNRYDTFQVTSMSNMPEDNLGGITAEIGLYNLVLVFSSDNVLERHSFVLIR
jgi:hypothetical protein